MEHYRFLSLKRSRAPSISHHFCKLVEIRCSCVAKVFPPKCSVQLCWFCCEKFSFHVRMLSCFFTSARCNENVHKCANFSSTENFSPAQFSSTNGLTSVVSSFSSYQTFKVSTQLSKTGRAFHSIASKLTDAWTKAISLLPSRDFRFCSVFPTFCVPTCASVLFLFSVAHTISLRCNILLLRCVCTEMYGWVSFLYFCDANTNTMHEKATPFGNRIGWVDCELEKGSKSITTIATEKSLVGWTQ